MRHMSLWIDWEWCGQDVLEFAERCDDLSHELNCPVAYNLVLCVEALEQGSQQELDKSTGSGVFLLAALISFQFLVCCNL